MTHKLNRIFKLNDAHIVKIPSLPFYLHYHFCFEICFQGMKIVSKSEDFLENLYSAQREALTSFGDQRVLVEKYILEPRHIEVQV